MGMFWKQAGWGPDGEKKLGYNHLPTTKKQS